jgi:hypothetical protein
MTSFSVASFSKHILHVDLLEVLYTLLDSIVHSLTTGSWLWVGDIWCNPSFLSDHCSQFILEDFSLVYLLVFPSWPLPVCSSNEGTWDVGSARDLSGQDLAGDASRVRDSQK